MSTRCLFNARVPAANWQNLAAASFWWIGASGTLYPAPGGSAGTAPVPEDATVRGMDECLQTTILTYSLGAQTGLAGPNVYCVSSTQGAIPAGSGVWLGGSWQTSVGISGAANGQTAVTLNLGNGAVQNAPTVVPTGIVGLCLNASTFPTAASDLIVQVWGMRLFGSMSRY